MIRRLREWQEEKAEHDREIAKRQYWQALSGCQGMQIPQSPYPYQPNWVNGIQGTAMQNQQGTAAQLYTPYAKALLQERLAALPKEAKPDWSRIFNDRNYAQGVADGIQLAKSSAKIGNHPS